MKNNENHSPLTKHTSMTNKSPESGNTRTKNILKIENKNELIYKNVDLNMLLTLREQLNKNPPNSSSPADVGLPSIGISTACRFLSGQGLQVQGKCSGGGACRHGNLDYQNNVSMLPLCIL